MLREKKLESWKKESLYKTKLENYVQVDLIFNRFWKIVPFGSTEMQVWAWKISFKLI